MTVIDGWHTYPTKQTNPAAQEVHTEFTFPKPGDVIFVDDIVEPASVPTNDKGMLILEVFGVAKWERKLVVNPNAPPGKVKIAVSADLMACQENCFFDRPTLTTELTISDEPPVPVEAKYKDDVEKMLSAPAEPPSPGSGQQGAKNPVVESPVRSQGAESKSSAIVPPATSLEEHKANLDKLRQELIVEKPSEKSSSSDLWSFLLTAAVWGAITLVTPCVFPMIPITVSYFLKQSEREHHRPLQTALIYCGTIIVVLSVAAWALLTVFRAMSVNPYTNIFMGGLFLVFAFSLFGLYELTLPQSITKFTSAREGRSGWVGTVFMALTFTVVSFSCVAPFLGGFGGTTSAGRSNFEQLLGAVVFATVFAAPFFLLALFPSLIKKLPKSGSWLNTVKVVMGFLELAAALKFFRTAELGWGVPSYFTYDVVMGIWVAIAVVCGLYLLNLFRFGHDDAEQHIGVVRALIGVGFISLGIYLTPSLFKNSQGENQRPGGVVYSWIDSFLLPEPNESDLPWSANLYGTVAEARKELERTGKPQFVFLDNTGITCTNCKYNERTVFTRGEIHKLFADYRLVQHYTDWVPDQFYQTKVEKSYRAREADMNKAFEKEMFGTEQLPLYVTMEVTKDKVYVRGIYQEGKINDVNAFADFLRKSTKPRAAK